ncbi:hypothetical protein CIL06_14415 [Pantoea vagans]|jgi:hypothetical protein|uniref:hypothetical protein n=1 Tax=Pantoea vagans TaxID=470934 RepID=UPI000BACA9E6|nr:hypothetical protein [Pantoea vagans]PAW37716.1 hypothetical protein CIL06_14415 [Pantoea vagans]
MTQQALRENLFYLINKYVPESNRSDFFESILKDDLPVKGILADLNRVKDVTMDEKDGDLLREIYFNFC